MVDVFVSYSRKDSDFARQIIDELNLMGKDAWIDWKGIDVASPNWWIDIISGIERSDSFLFIMSPRSMASVVCNLELDYAFELNKRIIPVLYEAVVIRDTFALIADFEPDDAMRGRLDGKDPLLIARDNWQRISNINWLFFRDTDDFNSTFVKLIIAIEKDLAYVKTHTRYTARAVEWKHNKHSSDLLLFGNEIDQAFEWLEKGKLYALQSQKEDKLSIVNPIPQDLQREYIIASKHAQRQRRRILQTVGFAIIIAVLVGALAITVAVNVQNRLIVVETSEANSNALRREVEFEAILFDVQRARAATQVAGLGLIPQRTETLSPLEILAEATAVATRTQWQPIVNTFEGVTMVKVPAGCFWMGDVADHNTQPVHEVCVDEFWIDQYEVTNEQYYKLSQTGIGNFSNWEDLKRPIDSVSWTKANDFCISRNSRLPTEAEWEYAARGPNSLRYPWGNDWIEDASTNDSTSNASKIVGTYPTGVSWVGAYDMAGNVWEWVHSIYDQNLFPYPYDKVDGRENPDSSDWGYVVRGGSFFSPLNDLRSANRNWGDDFYDPNIPGFRCARS